MILILCTFLSSILFSVSAANYYTFGGLSNSVVVEDNSAKYTVDIPFHALYVFDENLVAYRVDEGDSFTFYPNHTYKVSLISQRFLISDFPVDCITADFMLNPSGAASNADFSYCTCDCDFVIQFRDYSGKYISSISYPASYSSGLYKVSMIPEYIPDNAVYFDFGICLRNFFVYTSSDSSDYYFWLDKFSVTSIVERSGIFSRTVSLYGDTTNSLIEQFIFTDENYNCSPVYIAVVDNGFFVLCNDESRYWDYNDSGVFNGLWVDVDGEDVYLKPGDSFDYDGTHLNLYCDAEFSTGDNFIGSINNFVSSIGEFFSNNPFTGLLKAINNFRKDVSSFFSGLGESIGNFFSSIPDLIKPVIAPIEDWIESVGDGISNLGKDVSSFFGGLGDRIGNFFSSIPELIEPIIAPIKGWIDSIGETISNLGSSIVDALGIPTWISDLSEIVSNNFIVDAFRDLWDWIVSVVDFFSIPVTYDSANLTFWDYLLGRTGEDGSFWDYQDDAGFLAGISNFYSSVVDVWNAFPVPLRYLVMFGFGLPVCVGVLKAFLR